MESAALARSAIAVPGFDAAETVVETAAGPLRLQLTNDVRSVQDAWLTMQALVPCTCTQTYDWGRAWEAHVLRPRKEQAVIAIGYASDGTVQCLLPFETKSFGPLTVLRWLGQDHANYCFGLFRADFAGALSKEDAARLMNEIGRLSGACAVSFENQPFSWGGQSNPLALLAHQPAPNSGYAVELGDFEELYLAQFKKRARQTQLRKERRLKEAGSLVYGWANTPEQKAGVLDTFFAQKAQQFAAMGVTDIFGPEERAFYHDLAQLPDDNPSRLRLGYISLDEEILATFSGAVTHQRMIVLISSLADSPFQQQSPGAQLLRHEIEEACNAGLEYFDLGVGAARHKTEWSNTVCSLFDSHIALRPSGMALTLPRAVKGSLKRQIKSNAWLWSIAQKARKLLNSRKG